MTEPLSMVCLGASQDWVRVDVDNGHGKGMRRTKDCYWPQESCCFAHIRCVTIRDFQSRNARNQLLKRLTVLELRLNSKEIHVPRPKNKSTLAHKEMGGLYTATKDGCRCRDSSFGYQMKEAYGPETSWNQGLGFLERGRSRSKAAKTGRNKHGKGVHFASRRDLSTVGIET